MLEYFILLEKCGFASNNLKYLFKNSILHRNLKNALEVFSPSYNKTMTFE